MPALKHPPRLIFTLICLTFLCASPLSAGTLGLQWDPLDEPDLEGYRVYYGNAPGVYGQNEDVGNVTSHTLGGLADCTAWYVAVKAYDTGGLESEEFSDEISGWPRPVLTQVSPPEGEQGAQLSVTVSGTNYMDGALVLFTNPDITVNSVTWNSCTEVVASITIGALATTGATNVEVENPDGVYGTGAGLFTVLAAQSAPTITSHPSDQSVTEGRTATFTVEADGTAPLQYQWHENGVEIAGATSASYTTPPTALADDDDRFFCTVSNGIGSADSEPATLTVTEAGTRATDGLLVLYDFEEGAGAAVNDVGGVGAPLDLTVADTGAVSWIQGGLSVDASTIIESSSAAAKLTEAIRASGALTVEAWIRPANASQSGPARIVSVSQDNNLRDFSLGQQADAYDFRLRTTATDTNGLPSTASQAGSAGTSLTHVVYTRDPSGTARFHIDGVESSSATVGGDLSGWSDTYRIGLANEFSGDRAWLGEFHLVAVYERALSVSEINQNFQAGPDGDSAPPPNQAPTAGCTIDPASGAAPLLVTFDGTPSSDPDGTIVSYEWDFGDGTTGSGAVTTHEYTVPGSYVTVLTVTDDDGATDTDSGTVSAEEPVIPPDITSHPQDTTVNEGQAATFTVSADGSAPLGYQWRRNGVDIPGATSVSYTTPPTTTADDGSRYRCVVSNAAGSETSNPGWLTVLDATAPTVGSTDPVEGQGNVPREVHPVVTFSEAMDLATISVTTVQLLDSEGQPVPQASGSPSLSGSVVTVTPADLLNYGAGYRIRVIGGTGGVEDLAGNPMDSTYIQDTGFTVEPEPNQPPGRVRNVRRKNKKPKA